MAFLNDAIQIMAYKSGKWTEIEFIIQKKVIIEKVFVQNELRNGEGEKCMWEGVG